MATAVKRGRGRGHPRLSDKGKGEAPIIGLRAPPEFLKRLDKWRNTQEGKPKRSAALRQLAETALATAGY